MLLKTIRQRESDNGESTKRGGQCVNIKIPFISPPPPQIVEASLRKLKDLVLFREDLECRTYHLELTPGKRTAQCDGRSRRSVWTRSSRLVGKSCATVCGDFITYGVTWPAEWLRRGPDPCCAVWWGWLLTSGLVFLFVVVFGLFILIIVPSPPLLHSTALR